MGLAFAFARGGLSQTLTFLLKIGRLGNHELAIGNRRVEVTVAP